jgi:hypothetical protein
MRLVVASNRLSFAVSLKESQPQFSPIAGGLTAGLWSCTLAPRLPDELLPADRVSRLGNGKTIW